MNWRTSPHIDKNKQREAEANIAALRELIELNDEEGYVAFVKTLRSSISPEDLVRAIEDFRGEVAKRKR